jgi:hypothetical protein
MRCLRSADARRIRRIVQNAPTVPSTLLYEANSVKYECELNSLLLQWREVSCVQREDDFSGL